MKAKIEQSMQKLFSRVVHSLAEIRAKGPKRVAKSRKFEGIAAELLEINDEELRDTEHVLRSLFLFFHANLR